jgi:hypothetical protein
MRSFDIRVDYQPAQPGIAAGWYVYHGPKHSSYETLHNIFTQIYNWAVQPDHANEIIRLSLDIEGGDDQKDCSDFGLEMGHLALLTPDRLQNQFGTNNPGVRSSTMPSIRSAITPIIQPVASKPVPRQAHRARHEIV